MSAAVPQGRCRGRSCKSVGHTACCPSVCVVGAAYVRAWLEESRVGGRVALSDIETVEREAVVYIHNKNVVV